MLPAVAMLLTATVLPKGNSAGLWMGGRVSISIENYLSSVTVYTVIVVVKVQWEWRSGMNIQT